MLRFVSIAAIVVLILLRLAGTRMGARLLGLSQRGLGMVYLVALVIAAVAAVATEQWVLLVVAGVLLLLSGVEAIRRRSAAAR